MFSNLASQQRVESAPLEGRSLHGGAVSRTRGKAQCSHTALGNGGAAWSRGVPGSRAGSGISQVPPRVTRLRSLSCMLLGTYQHPEGTDFPSFFFYSSLPSAQGPLSSLGFSLFILNDVINICETTIPHTKTPLLAITESVFVAFCCPLTAPGPPLSETATVLKPAVITPSLFFFRWTDHISKYAPVTVLL